MLKCQYSPLHEFVSGACSRPSSCGIKVFYRKLSRPTFTNKVHIYAVVFCQGVVKYQNNGEKMSEISYTHFCCVMQKQSFADVPQNSCKKFCKIHKKTSRVSCKKDVELKAPTQEFPCEYCKIFKNTVFIENLWWLLFQFDKVTVKYWASADLLFSIKNAMWEQCTISRNHSNTFMLINLQKTKTCPK